MEREILFHVDHSKFIPLAQADYHQVVKASGKKPILVLISAGWCPDCRNLYPLLKDALFEEFKDQFDVRYVNTDENRGFARTLNVLSIPTLIVYQNGEEISRLQAERVDYDTLAEYLEKHL